MKQRRQQRYGKLLQLSRQILNDTRRVMAEVEELGSVKKKRVEAMMELLEQMSAGMKQVPVYRKARIFAGWTQMPGKLVSIFEPQPTEIIRKGKASKPTEFGKLVQIQEAENQIITHYEAFEHRPSDRELLLPAIEAQQNKLGQSSSPGHRRCRLLQSGSGNERRKTRVCNGWRYPIGRPAAQRERGLRKTPVVQEGRKPGEPAAKVGLVYSNDAHGTEPLPPSRHGGNETMGRHGSAGRQPHQSGQGSGGGLRT